MSYIFDLIKIIAITQVILVLLLLLLAYGLKVYGYYKTTHFKKTHKMIKQIFLESISSTNAFNPQSILPYRHHIRIILDIIDQFDTSINNKKWPRIRKNLIDLVVLPEANILASSSIWQKRYMACRALSLSSKKPDEAIIKILIKDPIPLVSINAAILAMNCNSKTLLDIVIDTFQQSRHVQQSLYAQIISKAKETIIPLIKNRLLREQDPYAKAFCYRTLTYTPTISSIVKTAKKDLESEHLELKLSVLAYLQHIDPASSGDLVASLLKDPHWEVRATSAKLLGKLGDERFADSLEKLLKDPEWWVRINTAEALVKLGPKGIAILKRQNPMTDQFAYDVSMQVLCMSTSEKHEH